MRGPRRPMSDIVDRANEHTEMMLRHALEAQRLKSALATGHLPARADWQVLSAADCEGPRCGEPIPDDRRRLVPGVRLCTECQTRLEKGYSK